MLQNFGCTKILAYNTAKINPKVPHYKKHFAACYLNTQRTDKDLLHCSPDWQHLKQLAPEIFAIFQLSKTSTSGIIYETSSGNNFYGFIETFDVFEMVFHSAYTPFTAHNSIQLQYFQGSPFTINQQAQLGTSELWQFA